MRPLCIFHSNCADGFGAAWTVWKFFKGECDFYPGVYQAPPPDCTGRDVIIVDFSYKRAVMETILSAARTVVVLDHHKTAIEDLQGLKFHNSVFDLARSGAMLAWDYYFTGVEPPALLKHIQDRDLWKFELEGTREIQSALFSYPYDFKIWDDLMTGPVDVLHEEGIAIERKHFKDISELLKVTQRRMVIGGFDVPVANLPYTFSSDAGHKMGLGEAFAACYYDTPGGRCFSLRSSEGAVDVGEIAKKYGGGGHKHAAGFTVAIGWEGEA